MYYIRNVKHDGTIGIVDTKDCVIEFLSKDLVTKMRESLTISDFPTSDVAYDYKSQNKVAGKLYRAATYGDNCNEILDKFSLPTLDWVLSRYNSYIGNMLKVYSYDHNYEFVLLCFEMLDKTTSEYTGVVIVRIGKYGGIAPYVFRGGRLRSTYSCGSLFMFSNLSGVRIDRMDLPEGIYVGVDVGNKTSIVNVLETKTFKKYTFDKII